MPPRRTSAVSAAALANGWTVADAARSDIAAQHGIDNAPPPEMIPALMLVAERILGPVEAHYGIRPKVNSWYRSPALEKQINWGGDNVNSAFAKWCAKRGKPVSEASWPAYLALKSHTKGEAVDMEVDGVDNAALAQWCRDNIAGYDQVLLEFHRPSEASSGWAHVSISTRQCRGECFTIDATGTHSGLRTA